MTRPVRVPRKGGGVAEIMAAAAASGQPALREAVAALYGSDAAMQKTLAVLSEFVI